MTRTPSLSARIILTAGVLTAGILTGCTNPISGADEASTEVALIEATATTAPPMPIITPTPVDPAAAAATEDDIPGSGERPDSYVVSENDTLYEIAARFEVDIARLVEVNNLSDPNDIFVGQELTIPPLE